MSNSIFQGDAVAAIHRAIMRGLREGAQIVRNYAVLNLTGRVLKRQTGRLASSVTATVTDEGDRGVLRVGTQVKYGGFWERGFSRWGRFYRRQWLEPAAEKAKDEIKRRIEKQLALELKSQFKSVNIDIRIF